MENLFGGLSTQDAQKVVRRASKRRFPVENVSWNEVQEFLKKLNEAFPIDS
jgi:hypothetical protein